MNDLLEKISKNISEEEIIDLIKSLVKIPSHPGIKNQETKVAEYIHNVFQKEGIHSEVVPVVDGRSNIIAKLEGEGKGKTLLLTGHIDTVPPYGMSKPFEVQVKDDKLLGRGVVDMKGPLACMIMAMIGLKRAGIGLKGDVIFAGVIDEEEKSEGTIELIESGIKADAAIVGEPSELEICIAHRGLEWFEFVFQGRAVHGGKQEEGINAILKASNFIQKVENDLIPKINKRNHRVTKSSSMNYGLIKGGTQPSTVAGDCILKVDRRWVPGEKYKDIINEYEEVIKELEKEDKDFKCKLRVMDVSVMREGYVHEAMEIDSEHPIIDIVSETTKEIIGIEPKKTSFTAWTDGGLISGYGKIPTIVFAPGDLESAHSSDEYLAIEQIYPATLIYAMTAIKFCK
ncbi:M20 family metallopeptidase [Sporosalibacterium faouarense]|uniref:M20 family metallopeptidase n=1 Tax=Sporosalibacterium faouarense TaxID=516123 RepID=UPI00192B71BD|nr:M20 family metallopeptidase [Sporosalibacterium faouarense]